MTSDITETYDLSFVRGRGNSTWELSKKPYKIKLDKKAKILGMSKDKNWALVANRFDNTKLRNKLTYWLGDQLSIPYTPKCVPVDVVMNGIYYGSYYISETIRVSDDRVDIDDLEENEDTKASTDGQVISGGYLLSYDSWGTDDSELRLETTQGLKLAVQSPSFDGYTNETQYNYIKDYVQKTEDALYGDDFCDSNGKRYTEYLDLDSAVDYYLMEEFSMNDDGYASGSNYLYKKRDGKLYWGPLWDFDNAYNNDERFPDQNKWIHNENKTWVNQMIKDPEFCNRLVERWSDFREKLIAASEEGGQIDKLYESLLVSERYDMEKWGFRGSYAEDYKEYPFTTFEEGQETYLKSKETLKTFIKDRIEWFDSQMDSLKRDCYKLTLTVDGNVYRTEDCYSNVQLSAIPTAPAKKGYLFKGWVICDENGKETSDYIYADTILTRDTTAKAVYVAQGTKLAPTKLYLSDHDIYLSVDHLYSNAYTNLYTSVYPKNAYGTLHFSSDKPEFISVDQKGRIKINKLATKTATITVTYGSQIEKCNVHVYYYMDSDADAYEETEMDIDKRTLQLKKGQTEQINVLFDNDTPLYNKRQWVSLDESVATVDACGCVTGVKAGTTTIYLMDSSGQKIRSCKITVNNSSTSNTTVKKTQKITVKSKTKTLRYSRLKKKIQTFKISATAKTGLTYKKVKGNKKITVTSKGKVKVRKKLRKGTYILKVRVSAKETTAYKGATKIVKIKIKVK